MPAERRAAPESPFSAAGKFRDDFSLSCAVFAFPARKRLDQAGVQALLTSGKRFGRADFDCRFVTTMGQSGVAEGKIAISVPKRLLKSAVARNRIKRMVREVYRQHALARSPVSLLVNYKSGIDGRNGFARGHLRAALVNLFDEAASRAQRSAPSRRTS